MKIKKVFISQPMNGLSYLQIMKERIRIIEKLCSIGYKSNEITIINSIIADKTPDNGNVALWYLGKSIELLSGADIAVFSKGWKDARGCRIQLMCWNCKNRRQESEEEVC